VPFKNLIDFIKHGRPLDEFLENFETVSREMAIQALQEAEDSLLDHVA